MNRDGFCECGCGQKTKIATRTTIERQQFKGKPQRYIKGHATKGKPMSQENREKVSKQFKGKTLSAEHIKKISEANKGKPKSFEARLKNSMSHGGSGILSPFLSEPTFVRYDKRTGKGGRWNAHDRKIKKNNLPHARLVYLEYKGEIPEGYVIHHINGDSKKIENDNPDNLLAVPEIWNRAFFPWLAQGFNIHESKVTEFYMKYMNDFSDEDLFFYVCKDLVTVYKQSK